MASDPYETLGVGRDASQDAIRAAYRKLAKTLHPDVNPGDRKAEERFKSTAAAYDLLSDAQKRARFDRGEIDASGAERSQHRYTRDFQYADADNAYSGSGAHADFGDITELFGDLFSRRSAGKGGSSFAMRGNDARYHFAVDFLDAVNGATLRITLPDGNAFDITVPPGTEDGQILRLRGKGGPGIGSGEPGDALVAIEVRAHPFFTRRGDDIEVDVPITLAEAVLGGKLDVPTPSGPVRMSVPRGANTGSRLRLKGKGAPKPGGGHGDEYVTLKVVLPEGRDEALEDFVRGWEGAKGHNPREQMER